MRRMKVARDSYIRSGPNSWTKWGAVCLGAQVAWFLLLLPLVPATSAAFFAEFAAGLVVSALIYGAVRAIVWLLGSRTKNSLTTALALMIALGIGVAIFSAAYWCREFLTGNFSYAL